MKISHLILTILLVLLVTGKVTIGLPSDNLPQVSRLSRNNNKYLNNNKIIGSSSSSISSGSNNNNNNTNYENSNKIKLNNDAAGVNGDDDQVTVDANSVISSTEIQGATPKFERLKSSVKKQNISLPIASTTNGISSAAESLLSSSTTSAVVESITKESLSLTSSSSSTHSDGVLANILPTTLRPRHAPGNSARERDRPLMDLLVARRNALPRKEYRTAHRRINTTTRKSLSSSSLSSTEVTSSSSSAVSKSPTNSRTTCERNCTKNFTKRTTASCMRRCVSLQQRLANATTATTTTTTSITTGKSSTKNKIDEKDNNEILLTDESSHGFFVVTKELNDTVNHIQDGIKISQTSTEKSHRNKYNLGKIVTTDKSALSVEDSDLQPYLFFGQKLPPPTILKITKLNDEHPKILEISVVKPTERIRNTSRRYNPIRNIVSHSRRIANSAANQTKLSTINSALFANVENLKKIDSSTEKLDNIENSTIILAVPKSVPEKIQLLSKALPPSALELIENNDTKPLKVNLTTIPVTFATTMSTLIPVSTTTTTAVKSLLNKTLTTLISVPSTTPTPSTLPSVSRKLEKAEKTEIKPTPLLINVQDEEEEQIVVSTETQTPSVPVVRQEKKPDLSFYMPPVHLEEKPNLIIFINETTTPPPAASTTPTSTTTTQSTIATSKLPEKKISTTVKTFTRTTISSSIRSTVYPRININITTSTTLSPSSTPLSINTTTNSTNLYQPKLEDLLQPIDLPLLTTPTPPNKTTSSTTHESNGVTIEAHRINMATYVLAGLGMFPIVVIILYVSKTLLFKKRNKDDTDLDGYVTDQQPISPVKKMDQIDDDDLYSILSDSEFERKKLRFKSLLGEGNFGQVWKAEADDLSGHLGTTRIVAVKTVRSGSSQVGLREEAEIMKKLGSHPNVVTLLGACVKNEPHFLIMEYAMRGRLLSLLRAARSATNILPASVPGGRSLAPLSPRTLAGFALDISRGMEYIADKKIVHRDLAARNVLLDHNGVCKICDFGMSIDLESMRPTHTHQTRKADVIRHNSNALENRFKFDLGGRLLGHLNHGFISSENHSNNSSSCNNNSEKKHHHHDTIGKRPALPIRWMAPEALQYHIFSTETDVWAFGIVLWEIATLGCTPYPNLSGREVVRNVPNGARPEIPKDGRHEFCDLITRCLLKNPQHRPTFREARTEIARSICKWVDDDTATSDYMDVSGFSEDLEHGMVYFNRRISEFECEI